MTARQRAYRVLVAASEDDLAREEGPVWDSGRRDGDRTSAVAYEGRPLKGGERLCWKVRAFDGSGAPGPWSATARFGVAPARGDFEGCLIGLGADHGSVAPPESTGPVDAVELAMSPPPYLRRRFVLDAPVRSAVLHATALGTYRIFVNGAAVSDGVLAPGWSDYRRRLLFQSYDVAALLVAGENTIAAVVADGWACGFYGMDAKHAGGHYAREPQLLVQLVAELADGSVARLATDAQWESARGAIAYADLLMGESVDLRRQPPGWPLGDTGTAAPGAVGTWRPASVRALPDAALVADPGPPIRITELVPAASVAPRSGGRWLVDFGQNLAGWVRLHVEEPAGTEVTVRHGEVLSGEGELYLDNLRTARATDRYVLAGGPADLEPAHTFHGFRYAEVSGLSRELASGDAVACVVHSDVPATGSFECSDASLNRLYANIDWGQRANFISIPTDCPQRDERLGWMGDAQVFCRTAAYNRDVAAFFSKWLDDVQDAQLPSGAFVDVAPALGFDWPGAPAWSDAGVIVPWTLYTMYGDPAFIERHFAAMCAFVDFLERENPNHLREHSLGNNYGDWLAPKGDHTPRELLATAYWYHDCALMEQMARVIGREAEALRFRRLAEDVGAAFRAAFVSGDGRVASGTQTAYALALHVGVLPAALREQAGACLVEAIEAEGDHISTGFVGVGCLLPVLSSHGYTDVAYRLLEQRSYPSWLYTLDRGATTIWERWDGWTEDAGFQSPQMNSFNHYSLGSVGEWLYRFVLGIEQAPGSAGFERVVLRPHPGGSLRSARGAYRSVRGRIAVEWRRSQGRFELEVEVPANVAATVHVASSDPGAVRGADGRGPDSIGVFPGARGGDEAVFDVVPGRHDFTGPVLGA